MEQRIELTAERKELFSLSHGISLIVKVYGDLSRERVKPALQRMFQKYPVLNSRICFLENGARMLVTAEDREIEPKYYPYGEVNYIERHIEKEECIPYDLEQGPLSRIVIFKGDERSVFLLMASRVIADGETLRSAAEEFVMALNEEGGQEVVRPFQMISLKDSVSFERGLRINDMLRVERINRMWKKQAHEFTKEEYLYHSKAYHTSRKTPVLIKEIRRRSTMALLNNCEERNVSMHSALLTAFLAVMDTFDRTHSGKEIPVHYAFDLRENVIGKGSGTAGKFDSLAVIREQYTAGLSFWDNVQKIDSHLKDKLGNKRQSLRNLQLAMHLDGMLLESLPFQEYGGFDTQAGRKALELFSEMRKERGIGIYSMKESDYGQESMYYIDSLSLVPPASIYNDLTIGAVITNGRLRLCIRYDKGHYSERIVEDMVRAAINYMWNRTETNEIRKPLQH